MNSYPFSCFKIELATHNISYHRYLMDTESDQLIIMIRTTIPDTHFTWCDLINIWCRFELELWLKFALNRLFLFPNAVKSPQQRKQIFGLQNGWNLEKNLNCFIFSMASVNSSQATRFYVLMRVSFWNWRKKGSIVWTPLFIIIEAENPHSFVRCKLFWWAKSWQSHRLNHSLKVHNIDSLRHHKREKLFTQLAGVLNRGGH